MYKRIVALAPSISETICTLGESKHLVGVTDFCNYPEYCIQLPKIGGFANPDVKKILALKPDLILATTLHNIEKLQVFINAKIKVIQIKAEKLLEAPETITQIGKAIGMESIATAISQKLQNEIESIIETGNKLNNKVKVCYLCTSTKFCNHKSKCQTNKLVEQLGGKLCMYSKETIVSDILKSNPEVIIIPYKEQSDDWRIQNDFILNTPEIKDTLAYKNNRIFTFNGELLSRPGPRAAKGLKQLFNIIHNNTTDDL